MTRVNQVFVEHVLQRTRLDRLEPSQVFLAAISSCWRYSPPSVDTQNDDSFFDFRFICACIDAAKSKAGKLSRGLFLQKHLNSIFSHNELSVENERHKKQPVEKAFVSLCVRPLELLRVSILMLLQSLQSDRARSDVWSISVLW